ncbi:putative autotransporter adhesin-like protein [Sphingomonas sp. F9_3S_D5_B_2]
MRRVMAIGILAGALAVAACSQARSEDAGPSISRNYTVGGFTAIEVAGPYEVEVHTGGNPGVSATGPQKMIEQMVVEVRGDRLLIRPEEHRGMFHMGWHSNGTVRVAVTVPQLQGASIAGSGDIRVNQVRGNSFNGEVAGSGSLGIDSLEVQTLKLAIAGSGDVKAAGGRAQSVKYEIGGSGDIDARGVQAQTADVSIAGSGSVSAHATGTADINMMGSGDVELTGGAKCSISKHGSGDVRCS